MIYVQAGLYAEGPSDYDFFIPLLERLLADLLAHHYPGQYILPEPQRLYAEDVGGRLEARIASAIQRNHETYQLFVIHADADGDATRARSERVDPGVRRGLAGLKIPAEVVACVPVHMTEAWLLADAAVFQELMGGATPPDGWPGDPERERQPKQLLQQMLNERRPGRRIKVHHHFGSNISLGALRRLSAFRAFEDDLVAALRRIAGHVK